MWFGVPPALPITFEAVSQIKKKLMIQAPRRIIKTLLIWPTASKVIGGGGGGHLTTHPFILQKCAIDMGISF